MDEKALKTLEFDKIIARLANLATTERGRERCLEVCPLHDPGAIRIAQKETSEAASILRGGKSLPLEGVRDVRPALHRARIGAVLEPVELLDIADTARASARVKRVVAEREDLVPLLAGWAERLASHRDLEEAIRAAITDGGEVADTASPELDRVRRAIRSAQGRIRDRLEALVRSTEMQKYLQDALVTVRDDRFVVPVKQEFRAQIPGVVHDVSGSGATVFIEPLPVVELNNEIRRLRAAEAEEVLRILQALTARVAGEAEALEQSAAALAEIDRIQAQGLLGRQMDASEPELVEGARLRIRKGRHPLLSRDAVPVDVHLGVEFDTLVITGPNTGGKTVTLKTVGLFVLMAQAGLHIPAGAGSEIGVFPAVFADIGDEQSIEQSLSTFSSHMTNVVRILKQAAPGSLVLLDEVGAGTDPTEGAALAMALLEHLHERGCKTIATTHYSELKAFAYTRRRVENASVEFDPETLRPTYKLLIGTPGRSNAFAIAARLGLDAAIVEQARSFLTREQVRVEDLIARMQATGAQMEQELAEAKRAHAEAERLRQEQAERMAEWQREEAERREKARREAADLVAQARREVEEVLGQLRSAREAAAREEAAKEARRRLEAANRGLAQLARDAAGAADGANAAAVAALADLKPGEAVEIISVRQVGHVLQPPQDGQVLVQAGILKVTVPLSDVRRLKEQKVKVQASAYRQAAAYRPGLAASKTITAATEIMLRGMTVDEALSALDKFLDDAILAGLGQVRVIHGKGTGTLRHAVHAYLKQHPHISGYRLGGPGEGSEGVTIATLA